MTKKINDFIPMDEMLSNEGLDPIGYLDERKTQVYDPDEIVELVKLNTDRVFEYDGHTYRCMDQREFMDMVDTIYNAKVDVIHSKVPVDTIVVLSWYPDEYVLKMNEHKILEPMHFVFVLTGIDD